jgi:hypothetical protein
MDTVIMVTVSTVGVLGIVAIVGIVAFAHTAGKVVGRSRREDLPQVLETVGRTQSGLVGILGGAVRQIAPLVARTPADPSATTVADQQALTAGLPADTDTPQGDAGAQGRGR